MDRKRQPLLFGKLAESISALVFLAEVHRNKDSGFYSFHELFCTSHIVFPDAVVHWKHGYVYRRGGLLEVLHLGKEVAFRFSDFLWGGLFTQCQLFRSPAWNSRMPCRSIRKRDAHVRGAECFDTDIRVFVHITFFYLYRWHPHVWRDDVSRCPWRRCSEYPDAWPSIKRTSRLKWSG